MKVYIGADHRGFELKEAVKQQLAGQGVQVEDVGASTYNKEDDYVDFAASVGKKISSESDTRGIVICGSGVGVNIAANKVKGIRCGMGLSVENVKAARNDDDINILALASDFSEKETAKQMVRCFLETPFSGEERHKRRIEKIKQIEMTSS